jgi:GNAT superfamily N-acetyltransferase
MYVAPAGRGHGYARAILAELERSAAAAGRVRMVLETGTAQPEALALYASCGYLPVHNFSKYRDLPSSRCFGKPI